MTNRKINDLFENHLLKKLSNDELKQVVGGRVTLVGYEKIGTGRVTVIVRGDVSEVQAS